MNTDTPETNEACGYASNWDRLNNRLRDEVPAEFARKLERERDEAREDLEFRRELYRVQENYLELARRERDEAREVLRELYFAVQRKFAEWAPKNNINAASEEAAK